MAAQKLTAPAPRPDTPLGLFLSGGNCHAQNYLGSHPDVRDGAAGYVFRVWAPHARQAAVMGDFNGWSDESHPMARLEGGVEVEAAGFERAVMLLGRGTALVERERLGQARGGGHAQQEE